MKHETFIKLYEERTAKGTWEAWRQRHEHEPRCKLLGDLPHCTVRKLGLAPKIGNNIKALRKFLLARYDSASPCVLPVHHDLPPRVVIHLLKVSGLDWFTKDDRFYIHWTHRLKEHHEQIQKAV